MFDDLDATLAVLLTDPAAPSELRDAETSFLTPAKEYTPAAPTVNFFLHGLQENRDVRTSVPVLTPIDHQYLESAPPMRMDCTYLVTTWSEKTGEVKIAEEHHLLAAALLWLGRFPQVPDNALQGSLRNPPQPYAVSTKIAQRADEGLAHFWTALGIAPRPTFTLTVTIALQTAAAPAPVARVEAVDIQSALIETPALTGRVLDTALAPVSDADITLVEPNQHTSSDERGRFTFPELPFGIYTLRVTVPNHPDIEQRINYRPTGQLHNVYLTAP
jgi:Pvc16 N-terminal domain/Carboxypeptidase regulatory-like domain